MSEDIKKMFDEISPTYDKVNNIISFFTHIYFKKTAINLLKLENKNIKILDLCCGSGDLANIIKKKYPKIDVFGVDFSSKMLEIAKKKNKEINYLEADACKLPFGDNEFDCVIVGFGLRNIINKDIAIKEIYRIIKTNGIFMHLDFIGKSKFSFLYDFIVKILLNFFITNKTPYFYLLNSKNTFFSNKELIDFVSRIGFLNVGVKKMFLNTVSICIFQKMD